MDGSGISRGEGCLSRARRFYLFHHLPLPLCGNAILWAELSLLKIGKPGSALILSAPGLKVGFATPHHAL